MRWFLLACAAVTSTTVWATEPDPRQFGWRADYTAARAEAKRAGKPLLVVFRCER